ncbi:MAG: hypothetical protein JRH15_14480, partial [Deltaproteobacteria bacterium]|nr:hypothetical protein [Deltaproteobacteria bacterium]
RDEEEDSLAEINIVGDPIIYGYISSYLTQTFSIFGLTLLAMIALLYFYTRSIMFMILPMISALISGIWGVGFAGVLGYNIDPLILVVPLLITARALSHSIQFNERLVEEMERCRDKTEAVKETIRALFYPGLSGVITDGVGILIIAIIPIPLLVKLAYICFFWALSVIFSVLFLNPVTAMCVPYGKGRTAAKSEDSSAGKEGFYDRILIKIAWLTAGKKRSWTVIVIVLAVLVSTSYLHTKLIVGDARPGTPILWPDSRYNVDEKTINDHFPGVMN